MYLDKLESYEANNKCKIGRCTYFDEYIVDFAKSCEGEGIDVGTGPKGYYSPFFEKCQKLDGCDSQPKIVEALPEKYSNKFVFELGKDQFPIPSESKDFALCSCVIQHLPDEESLCRGIEEISRILKKGAKFLLCYKTGAHNTLLTHFNSYYKYERTFRVFDPEIMKQIFEKNNFELISSESFVDGHWLPYTCSIVQKI